MADETCRAFDSVTVAEPERLHRFIVGADPEPRAMTAVEISDLGDPFATLLVAKGELPRTGEETIAKLQGADPKRLKPQRSFILGDGVHLPGNQPVPLRFVVTLGADVTNGPDVLLSVFSPTDGNIELMVWDRKVGGFNFYRSKGKDIWMFAGNSRDALRDSSRGRGPFESHPSGALIMKELKAPWINWHSPDGPLTDAIFSANDPRRKHPWFTDKEPGGALTFELEGARPAITRWMKARFAGLAEQGGPVTRPRMIMEQILGTPTVNLSTAFEASRALRPGDSVNLPGTFFADADSFVHVGLSAPPGVLPVKAEFYEACVKRFDVRMGNISGDTQFCFLFCERAFEDTEALRMAIEIGLVSKRLAACLLMVDPWNPVFSRRRASLLRHVPATAAIKDSKSAFSTEMAKAILAAADKGPDGTPEAEFAVRWRVGTGFAGPFNKLLESYYAGVKKQLKTQSGFDAYYELAEERRQQFKKTMPIAEFPLLLPSTNIKPANRRMRSDGTVRSA